MAHIPGLSVREADDIERRLQLNLASRHAAATPEFRALLDRYGWTAEAIRDHTEEFHRVMWNHHLETHYMAWQCTCASCREQQRRIPNFAEMQRRVLGVV